jgi:hypothetical protein
LSVTIIVPKIGFLRLKIIVEIPKNINREIYEYFIYILYHKDTISSSTGNILDEIRVKPCMGRVKEILHASVLSGFGMRCLEN